MAGIWLLFLADRSHDVYSQSIGASIGAPPSMNSRGTYNGGVSANDMTVTLSSILSLGWSVTVQAGGPFTNGSNTIPLSDFMLKISGGTPTAPSGLGAAMTYFSPATTAQTILSGLISLLQGETLTFSYEFTGGTAFLVPAGTYSTTLTFKYLNAGGIVQASAPLTVSIIIASAMDIELSNSNSATMLFNSVSAYTSPSPLVQSRALNVFSSSGSSVSVEATGGNLSNGAGAGIPVGNFTMGATPDPAAAGVSGSAITLSGTASGTIVRMTAGNLGQTFDLTFGILATSVLLGLPAATYATNLTLTVTAP